MKFSKTISLPIELIQLVDTIDGSSFSKGVEEALAFYDMFGFDKSLRGNFINTAKSLGLGSREALSVLVKAFAYGELNHLFNEGRV